ncbi:MAG: WecB/TagA/CpsF family glycosyltransferase [Leptospiraceae bacterium]|nr:WecB/TagA/CpsF family glycosyltransferase [Leptospiraceae bacterium]
MKDPSYFTHNSSKEERDILFEYQNIDISERPKLNLLGVDFDNIQRNKAIAIILDMIEKKEKFHHILMLDPLKLVNMRENKSLNRIPKKASLVLAEAGGMDWAVKKLGKQLEEEITLISILMDLIRYSEKKGLTLFFLGSTEKVVDKMFFNLIKHFPDIRIVGRHSGNLSKERELMVKEAIRKTSPDLIFLGLEFPDQELWIENNTGFFGKSVVIGTWNTFEVLAGMVENSTPEYFQIRNLHWLWKVISRPWKLGRVFDVLRFYFSFAFKKNK